jgi:hypothetical protein
MKVWNEGARQERINPVFHSLWYAVHVSIGNETTADRSFDRSKLLE